MIFNLGSINIDQFYILPHLPNPGETIAAQQHYLGLGGKGANQSVAIARAGEEVMHIGAVGTDGDWCIDALRQAGVDTSGIAILKTSTGHANICIDAAGENNIVLYPGANTALSEAMVRQALGNAGPGDMLVLQNETNLAAYAADYANQKGAFVIYSAAPFDVDAVRDMLPLIDLLVMNDVEAAQLVEGLGSAEIDVPHVLITKGTQGAVWQHEDQVTTVPAYAVDAVDTTGAGDCFLGYVVASLARGKNAESAMRLGAAAAALQVQRKGTADVMPTHAEVAAFLSGDPMP